LPRLRSIGSAALLTLVAACGGGGGGVGTGMMPAAPVPPLFTAVTQVRVSHPSIFAAGCDGMPASGTLYTDTAAEPYLAVNPTNPSNLIAAWQQNRWSDGGAQGLNLAASFDGGLTWTLSNAPFSRCTGGNSGNAGDYARATDVWLTVSPRNVVYALSLSFSGASLQPGSASGMLVAQSQDGGTSWGTPTALIQDGSQFFNDKGSITADPTDGNYVYAVWDRLTAQNAGPSYFAVTSNAGASWQAARNIYDPGARNQTIGNQIVVLPGDVLVDVFTELDTAMNGTPTASVRAIRSTDHGMTWSAAVTLSDLNAVGTSDPATGTAVRDGSDLVSVSVGPGGIIYVVWQDARFSGEHDGIAMTHSSDGGHTWSVPVQVEADHQVQAFTPTIRVRADGVIAVTYFDLRNNVPSPTALLTDCWMVTSSDGGLTFRETHLSGPFNLDLAPNSQGLFLGDYQSLADANGAFLPFYVQTDPGTQLRSDVFLSFPPAAAAQSAAGEAGSSAYSALAAPEGMALTAAARQRVMARTRLVQAQRLHRGS
jgi:hypothetical protein